MNRRDVLLALGGLVGCAPAVRVPEYSWPSERVSDRGQAWLASLTERHDWDSWFRPEHRDALRVAAGAPATVRVPAASPESGTRGEFALLIHGIAPAVLRAHGHSGIADRLEAESIATGEPLEESVEAFRAHRAEAHTEAPSYAPSPRVDAYRFFDVLSLDLHVARYGPFECGTGWPEHRTWGLRTLPLAAVAAGVDPRFVAATVIGALPNLEGGYFPSAGWLRG